MDWGELVDVVVDEARVVSDHRHQVTVRYADEVQCDCLLQSVHVEVEGRCAFAPDVLAGEDTVAGSGGDDVIVLRVEA